MANLRTNNLSGEQGQNAYRGSVFFDGEEGTYLSLASGALISGTGFGTNDFTIEFWINQGVNASNYTNLISFYASTNTDRFQVAFHSSTIQVYTATGSWADTGYAPVSGVYEHIAFVRNYSGNTLKMYANGEEKWSVSNNHDYNEVFETYIGDGPTDSYSAFQGYFSNLRVLNGTALYTTNYFTPPTSELKAIPNTLLLCCQNSDDVTQEETGKTITGNGNLANADFNKSQPKIIPPYGVDAGNAFGGSIQQSSQGYMYFSTGRTEERGGSRGILAGGFTPSEVSTIDFFNLQSTGSALAFGNLTDTFGYVSGYASHIRAVFSCNYNDPAVLNTLEFITIATQGNSTDFGDRTVVVYENGALSNETRGLVGGGYDGSGSGAPNNTETIDFNTIASLGNSTDFGDLTLGRRGLCGLASPTRGVFAAGYQQPSTSTKTNVIDFVTIASAGNASNFGDLVSQRWGVSPASSATRGVFAGGANPSESDSMEFITIASTGDTTDFGDLTQNSGRGAGTSDSIRGVFKIGYTPSTGQNTLEFVTIATTGNAADFGDSISKVHSAGMTSNAHGGLS